ncbi:MAG TPA: biotin--[acetyl-CoA-carboxylase] ligase, partial [Steroidobacteraceae bacterium]
MVCAGTAAPHEENDSAPLLARVFAQLSDGRFHSGEELAKALGVSRSAIWKATGTLRELGATLYAVRNRGYRLAGASDPLDAAKIRAGLAPEVHGRVRSVEAAWSTASTNTVLLARANPPDGTSEVVLAEYQTAGRGRRGRAWLAPPGGAICLSLSWTFREVPPDLGALSLVIGVCALRALQELGVAGAALKWPNDLLLAERKLGGVLIELRAESAGPACVVIG